MTSPSNTQTLNRLLIVHYRSLAMYLGYAKPSWHEGDEHAREVFELIVQDQQETVDRLFERIMDSDGGVEFGHFPMEFTGLHDLSFEFLLQKLIEHQRHDIGAIESCIRNLDSDLFARAVAEESLGAAKGHLESLLELQENHATGRHALSSG